jgi:hypothetical protein
VSVPHEQPRSASARPVTAGRLNDDGKRVYRMAGPQVFWWVWAALALIGLVDLIVQGHDLASLKFALGMVTVTGIVFACTLWPNVTADDAGMVVRNPFRSFQIPWGAVRAIFLADSVEVEYARPGSKKDKTVYCWALTSARSSRARARMRQRRADRGLRSRPSAYDRMPEQAKTISKMTQAEVMARELAGLYDQTRSSVATLEARLADSGQSPAAEGGATDVVSARWDWQPAAAVLVPAIAFAISLLVG